MKLLESLIRSIVMGKVLDTDVAIIVLNIVKVSEFLQSDNTGQPRTTSYMFIM